MRPITTPYLPDFNLPSDVAVDRGDYHISRECRNASVLLGAPFALTGAIWLLYALDYNLSIAVWVASSPWRASCGDRERLLHTSVSVREYRERGLLNDRIGAIKDGTVKRFVRFS